MMKKMNMQRRNFVRTLSLGTAHVLFSNPLRAHTAKSSSTNPLQKTKLGNSEIETTLVGIAMDKPEPGEVVEVIYQLHKSGKGIIGMKLVGNGKLHDQSEKIDNSLKFVLGLESVDMMIIGFDENNQVDNYLARTEKALIELNKS